MAIPLEKVYDVFYSRINIDLSKYPEMDVNVHDNLVESYLNVAVYDYEENLGKTLTIDKVNQEIIDDIPNHHIKILGLLIYKNYYERELNESLKIANHFNKRSELQVTGLSSKIVALRESLSRVDKELSKSFTRNMMRNVNKS